MQVAIRMANESGAELVLAHSWYLPPPATSDEPLFPPETIQQMVDDEHQRLSAATREATALGVKRVQPRFLTGMPWRQVVEAVQGDRGVDLVVMGTHGRTGFARILLGSVAEKVVRHAPCSVLVTRGASTTFKRVLCPVDFSEDSRHAVDAAAELAQRTKAEIALVHVVEVPVVYSDGPLIVDFIGDLEKRSARMLEQWAAELKAKVSVPVTMRSLSGSPGAQTLAVLDDDPAFDLVVVGSHGRTGIRRFLLGSVAEQIVRHAPCSVMVARARHDGPAGPAA